jgi:hypothetical protein
MFSASKVPDTEAALLAETLNLLEKTNVMLATSYFAGLGRNDTAGCCGLVPSHHKVSTLPALRSVKQTLMVDGNQKAWTSAGLPKDKDVVTHLPAMVSPGGFDGGSFVALTPTRSLPPGISLSIIDDDHPKVTTLSAPTKALILFMFTYLVILIPALCYLRILVNLEISRKCI